MSRELQIDLLFNYASLAVLAAGGFVMNLIVVRLLGETALGIFNQAYAIYVTASQLAVGGVHLSVLRSVAQEGESADERAQIIASGLALSLASGVSVGALVLLGRGLLGELLGSPGVSAALVFVAPALVLFSLNKTLLAALNGASRMRSFAVLQALRFVVLVAVLGIVAWERLPASRLTVSFLLAEGAVFLAAAGAVWSRVRLGPSHAKAAWLRRHASFGARGLLSGVLIELNTRIDVLVIGMFWSDEAVGRYSLAAVFAEGVYQCLVVLRNQMNPRLARLWATGGASEIVALAHRAWRYVYVGMLLVYLAGLAALAVLLEYVLQIGGRDQALACYAILGLGVLAVAGFVPFDGVLLLAGKPAHYTLFTFSIAATNALLNVALVPRFGIGGAAAATATALILSIASLNVIMRRVLGFSYLERARSRR